MLYACFPCSRWRTSFWLFIAHFVTLVIFFFFTFSSCLCFFLRAFGLRVRSALSRGFAVSALWWPPSTATRRTSCCSSCATQTRRRMFTFTSPYRKRATPFPPLPLMDWSGFKCSFKPTCVKTNKNLFFSICWFLLVWLFRCQESSTQWRLILEMISLRK